MTRKNNNLIIDIGNNNTVISGSEGVLFSEPSVVAFYKKDKKLKAAGFEAINMEGKVNGQLKVVRPLKAGVIADLDAASLMLKSLVTKTKPNTSFFFGYNQILASIPYASTEVERRALRVTVGQFSSKNTSLVFEPLAAAVGIGLNISEPEGKMLIDIGGGMTEIALISLSGIVTYQYMELGGDTFNDEIKIHFERKYMVTISDKTAELIKINVGAASNLESPAATYHAVGKDLITGIPKSVSVTAEEISVVLDSSIKKIEDGIIRNLEECPPELAGDIYGNGIHLTGGGSLLKGLKNRFESSVGLKVYENEEPLLAVSKGMRCILGNLDNYRSIIFK